MAALIGHAKQTAWRDYLRLYQHAFDAVRANLPIPDPGEFVILQSELPTWASPFVWRATTQGDYLPVTRSTRHTHFPGRMMNRERMREAAAELRWDQVDPDILDQACEGGCEIRTDAPLHTTASWHHPGVSTHFQVADDIVRAERTEEWTYISIHDLEYVPSVFSPRDVILQERSKLRDGVLELLMKPRVTHDMSSVPRSLGGRKKGISVNSGVPDSGKALPGMPSVQSYGHAQVVCDTASGVQHSSGFSQRRLDHSRDGLVAHVSERRHGEDIRRGRGSLGDWGNQFVMSGHLAAERARVLTMYAAWILSPLGSVVRTAARRLLRGVILGCSCAPDDCHGHVLTAIVHASESELDVLLTLARDSADSSGIADIFFDASLSPSPSTRPYRSGVYGIDKEKAYCFLVVQRADHYAMCYLWPDEYGIVRPHISTRVVFGGSPWPQRFERVGLLDCAWIQHVQSRFDAAHPPPPAAADWSLMRANLQRAGHLKEGIEQCRPAGVEPFIDDANGRSLTDIVPVPAHLHSTLTGAEQTTAIGASPAHPSSRLSVHCRIAIFEERRLGWSIDDAKTMCGDGMILLGSQLDTAVDRIRCPAVKRSWMLHAVSLLRLGLAESVSIDTQLWGRFVGRNTNLSQFFPELRLPLAVGYAIANVTWRGPDGLRRRPLRDVRLRAGGRRELEVHSLLDIVSDVVTDDWGVSMAPSASFDDADRPGVLTCATDASRADVDDGFGGYGFLPECPGVVFMMSIAWPALAKRALDNAALRRSERARLPPGSPTLSMPCAETFGHVALAAGVANLLGQDHTIRAVIAVGDCQPAAKAVTSLYSKSAQIRHLLADSRWVTRRWLGVHVPREWNTDADLLSHPGTAHIVAADAATAGLHIIWVTESDIPDRTWIALSDAVYLPMASDDAEWRP